MHDELTRTDIEKMKEELHQRRTVTRPQLLEAVKEARAFGDLSENFEYKAARTPSTASSARSPRWAKPCWAAGPGTG